MLPDAAAQPPPGALQPMSTPIPLFDLGRTLDPLQASASNVFADLASRAAFTLGDELRVFERDFAAFCGAPHCVGVSDGTAALRLGMQALGVPPGAAVVTVPHTFVATVEAIDGAGARPVLIDVDPRTRCMDPALLAAALGTGAGAVIPVHLYGRLAPIEEIKSLCRDAGAALLEDAAQAHGAAQNGRRAGAWGDAAAFSFYPTKNLGAFGDGGAVVCADPELAERVRSLRHHGCEPGDANRHVRVGGTFRLDNLQAALLTLRLTCLEQENEQRRAAAARYRELLAGLELTLPPDDELGAEQVFHLFVVEVAGRDGVRAALQAEGIGTGVHYPTPIHLQPAWRHLGYAPGDFPASERLAKTCLSLPCFPGITEAEQARVAAAVARALEAG
ncbi:MAG: DegT/DnrJ/EryC1/StrS family aminotransferase [Solirubrobacteraceae bacterium]